MKDKVETVVIASVIGFIAWFFSKLYNFFAGKLKEIDSIEDLKNDLKNFKEYKESTLNRIETKIDQIYENTRK